MELSRLNELFAEETHDEPARSFEEIMRDVLHDLLCERGRACGLPAGDCVRNEQINLSEQLRSMAYSLSWRFYMPIDVSKFDVCVRDKTPVTFVLLEGDTFKEETINVYHRCASTEVLQGLEEIEADGVDGPPLVTRQLIFLDLRSYDLTDGDKKPVKVTPETLARMGLPAQQIIARAIMTKSDSFAPLFALRPSPVAKREIHAFPKEEKTKASRKRESNAAQSDAQATSA
ncbi:MAG: hypothetical protein WCB68_15480 [Pyrinomonadaceae bacterium]